MTAKRDTLTMTDPPKPLSNPTVRKINRLINDGDVYAALTVLYNRWRDEHDYEDIADYNAPMAERVNRINGVTFVEMTGKPFGFRFKIDADLFALTVNNRGHIEVKLAPQKSR